MATLARRGITLAAAIISLVGPCGAVLTETGNLGFLESFHNIEIWCLVIIPAFGVALGIFSIYKGAKVAGVICLFTNSFTLALFGLLLYLFNHGWSR